MEKKYRNWLISIFLLTITTRLIIAFSNHNFTYESYFHLRQIEHITHHGLPLFNDALSYGGRKLFFLPFFHYLIASFNLFLPLELIAKILPNLFLTSLTIIVFLISKHITKNNVAALFSAFIAGFLPILFTTNTLNVDSLFLPLIFLNILAFLNLNKKKYLSIYFISFLILCFTSSTTFLLLIGFLIYIILSRIESRKINKAELEVILFSVFLYAWTQFLFFKNILIDEGVSFIWQNIPTKIIIDYFPKFSLIDSIILVSVIPFITGIIVVYQSLFQLKNKKNFLLISLVISTTILTWLRVVEFKLSLSFFAVILAILFASFYQDLFSFIKKTKFPKFIKYLPPLVILIIASSMIPPAINNANQQTTPSNEEVSAFDWINKNTKERAGVVGLLEEGHLITYYSKRKNLMDDQFDLIKDVEKRFTELNSLFRSSFQTQAISTLDGYNLQYIVFTPSAQEKYELEGLKFLSKECFIEVYNKKVKIYLKQCTLSEKK